MQNKEARGSMDAIEAEQLDVASVERTLAGDSVAFDDLIERHQRKAVAVAYRLVGNMEDALDVCQDAFIRAYRSLGTLQEPGRFGTWLMRIVSNLALNHRRARRPTLRLTTDEDAPGGVPEQQLADRSSAARPATDMIQTQEATAAITAAIEALPAKQRLALVLFALEEMPQKEVAEIMECSLEMVKWNVFQARKTLRERLADFLEE